MFGHVLESRASKCIVVFRKTVPTPTRAQFFIAECDIRYYGISLWLGYTTPFPLNFQTSKSVTVGRRTRKLNMTYMCLHRELCTQGCQYSKKTEILKCGEAKSHAYALMKAVTSFLTFNFFFSIFFSLSLSCFFVFLYSL